MGCGPSKDERTKEIDAMLRQQASDMRREVKMLLLGAGESGKSTLLKQMQLVYGQTWSPDQRDEHREVVYANTIQSMQAVIEGIAKLEYAIPPHMHSHADMLASLSDDDVDVIVSKSSDAAELDANVARAIRQLWDCDVTKDAVRHAAAYQLNDSARWFFDNLDRIAAKGYLPSDQDMLRTRVRTTGITEVHYDIKTGAGTKYKLRVFDVGGQRSERKKWIHCFENVTTLVFVAAINEYDQKLWEDESVDRIHETLILYDSIANSRWFANVALVLLLNKTDLFREKLPDAPLQDYMPEYQGNNSYESALSFMREQFVAVSAKRTRQPYIHATCATDTGQCRVVMAAVMDQTLASNLEKAGMI